MWHNVVTNLSEVSFVPVEGLLKTTLTTKNEYENEKNNLMYGNGTHGECGLRTKQCL